MMVDSSLAGRFIRGDDFLASLQIRGDAAALVAELRLDDDGQADFLGGEPSVFRVVNRATFGHWNSNRPKQCARELLILCDGFSDGISPIGFGGENPALPRALTQLN